MIDLSKIGYNVLEKDGSLEVTGGLTLTVKVGISSLAPDKEAMIEHAQRRIREKIWEMAYGESKDLLSQIEKILEGIDRTEADDGWWETSEGARHGTVILSEIRKLLMKEEP